ncbi:MAG: DUF1028 domain-containing protein [Hyphomicrobiales bacterium]|nr:DUF1028 domain-containing protein [Hyphomicrobiales bacterium]MBV9430716.1 DUF1028 domain-containing protein [Hyphomicrobiales bacterium]MBV9742040.1 DUF1028 domain-containing protein [Hyphomicrobiales bacterium]
MTWSIIARDTHTGEMGIAVATKFFAVGSRVPNLRAGIGALATQALTNPLYGRRGLALLEAAVPAEDVVRLLTDADRGAASRQVHAMDGEGRIGAHTGKDCVEWAGHLEGRDCSCAGNMLAGPRVVADTVASFERNFALPLARRMIEAMKAGEAAGGDKRGKQSACLVIVSTEEYSDLDLRVDDHPDPLAELERLEAVSRERWVHYRKFLPRKHDPVGELDRDVINAGIEAALEASREQRVVNSDSDSDSHQ